MDQELIAYLDKHFRDSAQQLASFREETNSRFEQGAQQLTSFREETNSRFKEMSLRLERVEARVEGAEEGNRHTRIMVEGLRDDVRLLAEKIGTFDDKIEAQRSELREEIGEVKTLLQLTYKDLDRRIG